MAGQWDVLRTIDRSEDERMNYRLYARRPEEVTKELVTIIYGERGEELI
jgi:hypothetical protein